MAYSQKELLNLMGAGTVLGENGVPEHIETVISNVFLFEKTVYKVYKNNNDFFNTEFRNLADTKERFSFTKRDFEWNHALSPSIYTKVIGVRVEGGVIIECPADESAGELVIVMNRIDTKDVLFEKLMKGELSESDGFSVGKQLAQSLQNVQKKITGQNFHEIFRSRIDDVRSWLQVVTEYVSTEESQTYMDFLDAFRMKHREWFETTLTDEMTVDGDFHSHNALLSNDSFSLIDTFAPKEEWMIGHHLLPVYRIGVDILALSGSKELFERYLKGYEEGSGKKIDRKIDPFYLIYASGISLGYLYQLQKADPTKRTAAERFHQFIRAYFDEITKGTH